MTATKIGVPLPRYVLLVILLLAHAIGCQGDLPVGPAAGGPGSEVDGLAGAAGDDDDDDDDDDPDFLEADDDAPPLAQTLVSFYAVKGKNRQAAIWYHAAPGETDSTRLVLLRIGKKSLLRYPNGTPVAPGDSVLITMEVVDTVQLIVELQPTGLRFSSTSPAKLIFGYGETDDDIDGDGDVDDADEALEGTFDIWRQETTEPYQALPSRVLQTQERVATNLNGFTRYAVAY